MQALRFFPGILFIILTLAAGKLSAQFPNGEVVNEKQLIDRDWHITNLKGDNPLLGAPGGTLQTNGFGESETNTFIIEDGPGDESGWTADERWFLIKSVTTGTYITCNGSSAGSAATLAPKLSEAGNQIYRQMFRLVATTPGPGWFKLRSRLSSNGPDLVLEVTPSGTLIFDSPKADPAQEQKFCFNLHRPTSSFTRYVILGKTVHHYLSDNGISTPGTPLVHNKYSNASVVWNIKPVSGGYFLLFNELTQKYAYDGGGSEVLMGSGTGVQAQWEMVRNVNNFGFKNRSSGKLIGTNGFNGNGSTLRLVSSAGLGGLWGIFRIDAPELSLAPVSMDKIEDGVANPHCVFYGSQFKRALAERVGLTPNEDYFPFIQAAIASVVGVSNVDDILKKFDLGNPGHRIELALMVRKYIINDLSQRPRHTWSALEEFVITEYENQIETVRANYANRLIQAWNNHLSNSSNSSSWGVAQLLESVTAEGFEWPLFYQYASSAQEQEILDYAAFAQVLNETNPNIPTGIGVGTLGITAALGVAGVPMAVALFTSEAVSISATGFGLIFSGGPVLTVATFVACAIAIKALEVNEVQQLMSEIESRASENYQPVNMAEILTTPNLLDRLKLFSDLDYVIGAPQPNGFQYNFNDNEYIVPFTLMTFDQTVELGPDGTATLNPAQAGSLLFNCSTPPVNMVLTTSEFDCSDLGSRTVTLSASNAAHYELKNLIVTVVDHLAPVVTCKPAIVVLNNSGTGAIGTSDILLSGTDNCGTVKMQGLSKSDFTCADVGTQTVTLSVHDNHGNTSSCNAIVTVADQTIPSVVCKPATVMLDHNGNGSITTTTVFQSGSDNCGEVNPQGVSKSAFTCADIGLNTITLTVNDGHGNTNTCYSTVTVTDQIAPAVVCKNATVLLDNNGAGSISMASVFQSGSDNCGVVNPQGISKSSFTCADIGFNTIILTVNDGHGNTGACTTTVTVIDNIAPSITCSTTTVYLNATGSVTLTPADVQMTGTDNCGVINRQSVTPSAFNCSQIGVPNTVLLTVNDGHGNVTTCNSTVKVIDNMPPAMACKNIIVHLDAGGNASITASQINNGSYDNCAIATLTTSSTFFTCANIGANTVTLTGADPFGNQASCQSTVTVKDVTPPTALCKNATVALGSNGMFSVLPALINNGSGDLCGITAFTVSPSTLTCANVGSTTVVLSVTDAGSNTSTCTARITLQDKTPPTASCKNITVFLNSSGQAGITANAVNNNSFDACSITFMGVSNTQFNCSNIGSAVPVTLTVRDAGNNQASCQAYVTVKDVNAPTAYCENVSVQLNAQGRAMVYGSELAQESEDNCSVWSFSPISRIYTTAHIGVNNLTVTVKDWSNNAATCVAQVTVLPYNNFGATTEDRESAAGENPFNEFAIFPNPTSGDVVLEFELPVDQDFSIAIFDMSGRIVSRQTSHGLAGANQFRLSTEHLTSGVFIVEYSTGEGRSRKKLVVQRD